MSAHRLLLVLALALISVVIALAAPAWSDTDDALDLVDEADAALKKQDYAGAAALYREALEEAPTCLPARHGLAEALLASADAKGAVVAWRQLLRDARAATGVPVAWEKYAELARARLAQLDENGKELEAMIDEHVAKVMKVAVKYKTKDPDLSVRALQVVLALRPEHERANEILGKLSSKGARKEAIFDGKQIADWDGGRGQWWRVKDGVIVSETKDVATFIRNQKVIEGNFDVLMEARIAEAYDDAPFLALMAAWNAEYDHTRFGTLSDALSWYEHRDEDDKERVYRCETGRLPKPYDPAEWTTYELRYRDEWVHAFVNGREVHKIKRPKKRTGGYVGILSQGCRGEIKRLDVLHR